MYSQMPPINSKNIGATRVVVYLISKFLNFLILTK